MSKLPLGMFQTPDTFCRETERYSCCDGHWRCYCLVCLGCGKSGVVNAQRPTDSPLCADCFWAAREAQKDGQA